MNMHSNNGRETAEKGYGQTSDRRRFLGIAGTALVGAVLPVTAASLFIKFSTRRVGKSLHFTSTSADATISADVSRPVHSGNSHFPAFQP